MSWTFRCLNTKRCGGVFTADSAEARCPKCRTKRLRWLPQHFGVMKVAPGADKQLRGLAGDFGMSNMRSAKQGEAAMPSRQPPSRGTVPYTPVEGWGIQMNTDASGAPVATCAPAPMSTSISVKPGTRATRTNGAGPVPVIEASHKAK